MAATDHAKATYLGSAKTIPAGTYQDITMNSFANDPNGWFSQVGSTLVCVVAGVYTANCIAQYRLGTQDITKFYSFRARKSDTNFPIECGYEGLRHYSIGGTPICCFDLTDQFDVGETLILTVAHTFGTSQLWDMTVNFRLWGTF